MAWVRCCGGSKGTLVTTTYSIKRNGSTNTYWVYKDGISQGAYYFFSNPGYGDSYITVNGNSSNVLTLTILKKATVNGVEHTVGWQGTYAMGSGTDTVYATIVFEEYVQYEVKYGI